MIWHIEHEMVLSSSQLGLKTNTDFKQPFVRTYCVSNDLILSFASWAKLDYIKKTPKKRKTKKKTSDKKIPTRTYTQLHIACSEHHLLPVHREAICIFY